MRTHKKLVFITILALSLLTPGAIAIPNNHRFSEESVMAQAAPSDAQYPIADYKTQLPADPGERARRKAINNRHDIKEATVDVQQARLKEDSPAVLLDLPLAHAPAEPAIPAQESDAIVIGEVTNAQAYLSNDKTSIYSEFTVRMQEALKQVSSLPLTAGNSIAAERQAGAVRFPSGKILRRGALGKNSLVAGRRYVLFLKYINDTQDYSIITGYELLGGQVFPLDGLPESEGKMHQFEAYRSYAGIAESTFLSDVKAAVGRPSPSGDEQGRQK